MGQGLKTTYRSSIGVSNGGVLSLLCLAAAADEDATYHFDVYMSASVICVSSPSATTDSVSVASSGSAEWFDSGSDSDSDSGSDSDSDAGDSGTDSAAGSDEDDSEDDDSENERRRRRPSDVATGCTVFVRNLSFQATDEDVQAAFGAYVT